MVTSAPENVVVDPFRVTITQKGMTLSPKMNALVEKKVHEVVAQKDTEDAFFVFDKQALETQVKLWEKHLPTVTPHYAVKCNSYPEVVKHLYELGTKFDCASREEIKLVISDKVGAKGSDIVYANPVKAPSQLKYAAEVGVKRTTFDNLDELRKVAEVAPETELLLRIKTDDSNAVCSLSCKFGAALVMAEPLLAEAQKLGVKVVGVAYHVGSGGGTGASAHKLALKDAREVFELARSKFGIEFSVLDVGGGFEPEPEQFAEVAAAINEELRNFPSGIKVIGEPGRFMAAPAMTLVANVIGVRHAPAGEGVDMAYITDGVYGNLNSIIYDHQEPKAVLLGGAQSQEGSPATTSLWGPTCDGLDSVSKGTQFPRKLKRGDWVCFVESGAYTIVGGSEFNGFNTNTVVYTV